jgi:hypothetical protein
MLPPIPTPSLEREDELMSGPVAPFRTAFERRIAALGPFEDELERASGIGGRAAAAA